MKNTNEKLVERYAKSTKYLYTLAFWSFIAFIIVLLFFREQELIYRILLIIAATAFVQGGMLKILNYYLRKK